MITELDDLAIHQIYSTMDHVDCGDPRWCDKLWFNVGTKSGELSIAGHMGVYPNTNTMDAAGAIRVGNTQCNVRAARELQHDRDNRKVWPFSAEIVEHFKRWRFVLTGDNDQGIAYELEFESAHQPMDLSAPVFHRQGNHVIWNMWHYVQLGRVSGTATANGRTLRLDKETCWGARDRSWGIRPIFGQIPEKAPLPESICSFSLWLAVQFDDHDLWCWLMEPVDPKRRRLFGSLSDETGRSRFDGVIAYAHDDEREKPRLISIEHDLNIDPASKAVKDGNVVLSDWDGNQHNLSVRGLSTVYLKGLGYGHPDFRHMEYKGTELKQGEALDLAEASSVAGQVENSSGAFIPFGVDTFCEFRMGNQTGYGVVRVGI